MTVTILGNNSALPAYGRHPTAQVVRVEGQEILLDCGEGTQSRMQEWNVRWRGLEHVCISHLHGDHYFGIFGFLTSMSLLGRTTPLHLYAPAALESMLAAVLDTANAALCYPLLFHPLPVGAGLLAETKHFRLSCFPTEHRIACHGFLIEQKTRGRRLLPEKTRAAGIPTYFYERLKAGEDYERYDGVLIPNEDVTEEGPKAKRYAYCADTLYTGSFLPFIAGADTVYHESTYLSNEAERARSRFHSTAAQAAMIARDAGAAQLLLGHYSSRYRELSPFETEAREIFPNSAATIEGTTYEV